MLVRRLARNLALLSIVLPSTAWSLGLGDITVTTALNRPLRAQIKLLSVEPGNIDDMRVRLASQEAFERVGIERPFVLTELQFKPEQAADGRTIIEVTTKQPVREPFLNFLVEVEWPNGRLLREYTVLLDPPVLMDQPGGAMAQAPVVASQAKAAPATSTPAERTGRQPAAPQSDHAQVQEEPAAAVSGSKASVNEARRVPVEYNVAPGDTLGEIAQRYLPDENTGLSQMMMAILHANPDAFSQGNINSLKSGVVLRIPAGPELAAVDEQAALAEVARQNNLWREYQAEVTDVVPSPWSEGATAAAPPHHGAAERAMTATTGQQGELQDSTAAHPTANHDAGAGSKEAGASLNEAGAGSKETTVSPKQAGQLEIMASRDGAAKAQVGMAGDNNENSKPELNGPLARELAESQRVEIDSLNGKVAELESMVTKQARIISLQSKALADLQRRVASNEDAVVTQDEQAPAGESATAKKDASTSKAELNTGTVSNLMTHAAGAGPMAKLDPAAQNADDEVAPPSSGLLQDVLANPAMLAGIGGGALLLAFVWLVVRRAAAKRGETVDLATYEAEGGGNASGAAHVAPPSATRELKAQDSQQSTTPVAAVAQRAESNPAVAEPPDLKPAQREHALNDDTLAEADVYIAYALYQQAEDVLKGAIGQNANNDDYRMKLLEVHYAAKNRAGFDAEAQALSESLSGSPSPAWDRVMIMGRDLSPHNPMFNGSAAGGSGVQNSAIGRADTSDEPGGQGYTAAANTGTDVAATSEQTVLIIDNAARLDPEPGDLSRAHADSAPTELSTVTYGDEILGPGTRDFATTALGGPSAEVLQPTARLDEGTLDFDLSDLEINDTGHTEASARFPRAGVDEHDVDLPDNVQTQIAPRAKDADGELFAKDINMDELQVEDLPPAMPDEPMLKLADDLDLADLEDLSGDKGVGTKLDLAKAYIDMGDADGALSTLEEVLEEGDDDQRKAAEVLMRRIA